MSNNGTLVRNLIRGGSAGGGSPTEIALLSVTTAPSGSFAVGSKYYNSSTKKIVTAVTADTWTGATSADPVFNTIYTFNSGYYIWNGDTLESTDLNLYILKSSLESGVVATNLDTIVKNGFYTCYGEATGVPSVDYSWFVIHQNSNVNTASATQRAVAYYKDSMIVYERVKTSSAWGDWKTTDLNLYEKVANKSNSYTVSSETTYASSKALVDGLGTKVNGVSVVSDLVSTTATLTVAGNTIYKLGTLTALTLSTVETSDLESIIYFTSDASTASLTDSALSGKWVGMSGSPTLALDTEYVISICNGIGVIGKVGA